MYLPYRSGFILWLYVRSNDFLVSDNIDFVDFVCSNSKQWIFSALEYDPLTVQLQLQLNVIILDDIFYVQLEVFELDIFEYSVFNLCLIKSKRTVS